MARGARSARATLDAGRPQVNVERVLESHDAHDVGPALAATQGGQRGVRQPCATTDLAQGAVRQGRVEVAGEPLSGGHRRVLGSAVGPVALHGRDRGSLQLAAANHGRRLPDRRPALASGAHTHHTAGVERLFAHVWQRDHIERYVAELGGVTDQTRASYRSQLLRLAGANTPRAKWAPVARYPRRRLAPPYDPPEVAALEALVWLVLLVATALAGHPLHLVRVHEVAVTLPANTRRRLGITRRRGQQVSVRQLSDLFNRIAAAVDPSPHFAGPDNEDEQEQRQQELQALLDALLEASVPDTHPSGAWAVDATDIPAWSRPRSDVLASHDPDAGWYVKRAGARAVTLDGTEPGGAPKPRGNSRRKNDHYTFGYELHALVRTRGDDDAHPSPAVADRIIVRRSGMPAETRQHAVAPRRVHHRGQPPRPR